MGPVLAAVLFGAVVVSLVGSSAGAGEGWGWEGLAAGGWGLASEAG